MLRIISCNNIYFSLTLKNLPINFKIRHFSKNAFSEVLKKQHFNQEDEGQLKRIWVKD